ncbi:Hypothetical protein D9617_20g027110 [Elsinoe fawcettii]|nr:Hypothetical protein D9617_20g027110 [Elsinoe fawcettii]
MSLKRKRSSASLSPSSIASNSPAHSCLPSWQQTKSISPSHNHEQKERIQATDLESRTQKRWRDNRPPESIIHAQTLHKLFTAQRQPHMSPPVTPAVEPGDQEMSWEGNDQTAASQQEDAMVIEDEGTRPGQRSLEAFWGRR